MGMCHLALSLHKAYIDSEKGARATITTQTNGKEYNITCIN